MTRHQYCSIPGCESRSDKPEFASLKFHRLPQSTELRHQWLVSIKCPLTVSENTIIYTVHFNGNENRVCGTVWSEAISRKQCRYQFLHWPSYIWSIYVYIDISNLFLVSFVYAEQMYVCIVNDRINLFPELCSQLMNYFWC